jgi:predicted metal-dependent enzyme (double-stranded beta helix superfamily)
MSSVNYSLAHFVQDMEGLLEKESGPQKIFEAGASWLERLTGDPSAIPAQYRVPAPNGRRPNHGSYLLYQGDSGLSVTAVVWGPGEHLGPHDHRTWGMIGILDNTLTETRYRRVDDGSNEGYALLEQDRRADYKPGEITLLVPDQDEIHQMDNQTNLPTVEVHVYGSDLRGIDRSRYDLETGKVTSFKSGKYDNC